MADAELTCMQRLAETETSVTVLRTHDRCLAYVSSCSGFVRVKQTSSTSCHA